MGILTGADRFIMRYFGSVFLVKFFCFDFHIRSYVIYFLFDDFISNNQKSPKLWVIFKNFMFNASPTVGNVGLF